MASREHAVILLFGRVPNAKLLSRVLAVSVCCPGAGPIKATDPERAAANRATRRKQILRMACTEGSGLQEDVAAAEAEYEAAQDRCTCRGCLHLHIMRHQQLFASIALLVCLAVYASALLSEGQGEQV